MLFLYFEDRAGKEPLQIVDYLGLWTADVLCVTGPHDCLKWMEEWSESDTGSQSVYSPHTKSFLRDPSLKVSLPNALRAPLPRLVKNI